MKLMNDINLNIFPFIANTKMMTPLEYLLGHLEWHNKDVQQELTPIKVSVTCCSTHFEVCIASDHWKAQ
jgi:hypothetical protein